MKNLTRSSSHENVLVSPFAKLVHSKPTSYETEQANFHVQTPTDTSINDYVVPSAYQSASSALAVSFLFVFANKLIVVCRPSMFYR